jgi:hypothetical protein
VKSTLLGKVKGVVPSRGRVVPRKGLPGRPFAAKPSILRDAA